MEGKRLPCGLVLAWRYFLLGYKRPENHRYSCEVSTRSPPLPCIAPGPHKRICEVHYYKRDPRRDLRAPLLLPPKPPLSSGVDACGAPLPTAPLPGCVNDWDDHEEAGFSIDCLGVSSVRGGANKCGPD